MLAVGSAVPDRSNTGRSASRSARSLSSAIEAGEGSRTNLAAQDIVRPIVAAVTAAGRRTAMTKVDAHDRAQLVIIAYEAGPVRPSATR